MEEEGEDAASASGGTDDEEDETVSRGGDVDGMSEIVEQVNGTSLMNGPPGGEASEADSVGGKAPAIAVSAATHEPEPEIETETNPKPNVIRFPDWILYQLISMEDMLLSRSEYYAAVCAFWEAIQGGEYGNAGIVRTPAGSDWMFDVMDTHLTCAPEVVPRCHYQDLGGTGTGRDMSQTYGYLCTRRTRLFAWCCTILGVSHMNHPGRAQMIWDVDGQLSTETLPRDLVFVRRAEVISVAWLASISVLYVAGVHGIPLTSYLRAWNMLKHAVRGDCAIAPTDVFMQLIVPVPRTVLPRRNDVHRTWTMKHGDLMEQLIHTNAAWAASSSNRAARADLRRRLVASDPYQNTFMFSERRDPYSERHISLNSVCIPLSAHGLAEAYGVWDAFCATESKGEE